MKLVRVFIMDFDGIYMIILICRTHFWRPKQTIDWLADCFGPWMLMLIVLLLGGPNRCPVSTLKVEYVRLSRTRLLFASWLPCKLCRAELELFFDDSLFSSVFWGTNRSKMLFSKSSRFYFSLVSSFSSWALVIFSKYLRECSWNTRKLS